jgi:hypothetical protein
MSKELKILEEVISYVKGSLYVLDRIKTVKSDLGKHELQVALVRLEEAQANMKEEQVKQRKEYEESEEKI